jgi:hypothetical protein
LNYIVDLEGYKLPKRSKEEPHFNLLLSKMTLTPDSVHPRVPRMEYYWTETMYVLKETTLLL